MAVLSYTKPIPKCNDVTCGSIATPKEVRSCPFCQADKYGVSSGWGMSQGGWESMKRKHDAGHPSETNKADYLKEFDEFSVAKRFTDYPLISINDYVSTLSEIKKLFVSSIERARREGYNTGFDMGSASVEVLTSKAIKNGRQRVVEMILREVDKMSITHWKDRDALIASGIYNQAIYKVKCYLQSKLEEK